MDLMDPLKQASPASMSISPMGMLEGLTLLWVSEMHTILTDMPFI
jgi:hypothetical protein